MRRKELRTDIGIAVLAVISAGIGFAIGIASIVGMINLIADR